MVPETAGRLCFRYRCAVPRWPGRSRSMTVRRAHAVPIFRRPRRRAPPRHLRPGHGFRPHNRADRNPAQHPLARRRGPEPDHSAIRRPHRRDPQPQPPCRRGHPLRQRVLRLGRVRTEPVHPGDVRLHHERRRPPHAHAVQPAPPGGRGPDGARSGDPTRCAHDERSPPRARLLRDEQRQDRPPVRADRHGVGRIRPHGDLARETRTPRRCAMATAGAPNA